MQISITRRRFITLVCFAGFIALGIASGILGPTLPDLAGAVTLSLASAGILRAMRQFGSFVAILGGGRLLDRRDPRAILVIGAFALVFGLIGMAFGQSLVIVLAASLLMGVGSGFFDVGPNYVIGALYASSAGAVLAALHMFYGLGASAGPALVEWARVGHSDWRLAYSLLAALTLVVGALYLGVGLRTPRPAKSTEKAATPIAWLPLLPLIALILMYNGAGSGVGDWIYTHVQLVAGSDVETASRVTSVYWLALTAGRLISIFALRLLGNMRVLAVGLASATIGAALIVLAGAQVPLVALGVLMVGIGFAPIYPVVIAIGGQRQPEARGTVIGVLSGAAAVGGIIIPVAQGWIGGGHSGGMIVTLAAALIMDVALVAMYRLTPAPAPVLT